MAQHHRKPNKMHAKDAPSFAWPKPRKPPETKVQVKSNPRNAWLQLLAATSPSHKDQLYSSLVSPLLIRLEKLLLKKKMPFE